MDDRLAQELESRMADYSLSLAESVPLHDLQPGDQSRCLLRHSKGTAEFTLAFLTAMSLTSLSRLATQQGESHPLLIIGPKIGERSASAYRASGIQFLDAAGNAYLDFAGALIDVRGRRTKDFAPQPDGRGAENLFSTRRSQVLFVLLSWPELIAAPIRDVAHAGGVSLGQAHGTLKLLERSGFVDVGRQRKLRRTSELLERWVATFPTGLASATRIKSFAGDVEALRSVGDGPMYVSGESATDHLRRPQTLVLYVDEFQPRLAAANRWRTDREPNVFVRRKFWTAPGEVDEPADSIVPAPPVLIYADLLATREGRQREAAEVLRANHAELQRL